MIIIRSHVRPIHTDIHGRLPAVRLATLMKALQPTPQHNESVHALYGSLQDRVGTAAALQDAAASAAVASGVGGIGGLGGADGMDTDFDSPLKSMPTPGPHSSYM